MDKLQYWTLHVDEDRIAWLGINCPGSRPNTLSRAVLDELHEIVDQLNIDLPKGLALYSEKENGFIAGAEISEFSAIESVDQAREYIARVHRIFNCIEAMPIPKVALVHGYCLGGGMELVLCFDYLIVDKNAQCKLGLPEVKLGIHPGFGGSVRLVERIGVVKAMELMLGGRVIPAYNANKLGMVDQQLAKRYFRSAARDFFDKMPARKRAPKWQSLLSGQAWLRNLLASYLDKQLRSRVKQGHYPAPYALVDLWREYGGNRDRMLEQEIDSVSRLIVTDTARNLVRVFFLQETLRSAGRAVTVQDIQHIHVVGAGVMGGDIAAWSALRGIRVTLQDQSPDSIARAVARAHVLFKKKLKIRREVQAAMDRLVPDLRGEGVPSADLIIEAIFENLEAKQTLFSGLEARASRDAILASNTSSIPVEAIAAVLKDPSRLVGIHFFNPVAKMQLVEVVRSHETVDRVLDAAKAYALQIGRLPVEVRSSPGFLVNRVLMPYLIEAVTMLDDGLSATQIDHAAMEFGMPMGPVELADVVGLDICLHVAENLLGDARIPQGLKNRVAEGKTGKKTGQGFYPWVKGKPQKPKIGEQGTTDEDLSRRMLYPMINECIACLNEGVVASADELDAGVIFGTGFAPFTGGPVQLIRTEERETMINRLEQLKARHGDRFKADEGWRNMTLF